MSTGAEDGSRVTEDEDVELAEDLDLDLLKNKQF